MSPPEERRRIVGFLKAALECSIYLAPTEPGLTYDELLEAGGRVGFQRGEMADAMSQVADVYFGRQDARLQLRRSDTATLPYFEFVHGEPDYRNPQAFDFVRAQLRELARANGVHHAKIERGVLVERAVVAGLPRLDVEAAITIMLLGGVLNDEESIIGIPRGSLNFAEPSEKQVNQRPMMGQAFHNEASARAYPVVKDMIARRQDGRPRHAEPLDAFADELDRLGYGRFRLWWSQIVAEFRQASPQTAPVSATVLAAAIVEGALAFVAKHAHTLNLGVMGSKTFEDKPNTWSIGDLVGGAVAGRGSAILEPSMRQRADTLIRARQRIHPGRMLTDFPAGPPDLRPEEARDAKMTAEQVVRCVLDWLHRYPVS